MVLPETGSYPKPWEKGPPSWFNLGSIKFSMTHQTIFLHIGHLCPEITPKPLDFG